ncbi:MAG TPA: PilZ domain-containing protein [Anaerolineaceae bacterium]
MDKPVEDKNMEQTQEILDRINQIVQAKETIHFLNCYRGISISYEGVLREMGQNSAIFSTRKYQLLCMRLEAVTYLQSNLLPEIVKARVSSVDIGREIVSLTKFEYTTSSIGNRMQIRVEPDEPVRTVVINKLGVACEMIEISLHGLSVYMNPANFDWRLFQRNSRVMVEFTLREPNQGRSHLVRVPGVIKYVSVNTQNRTIRLGLFTSPDNPTEAFLSHYIASRQADLLKEIRSLLEIEEQKDRKQTGGLTPRQTGGLPPPT